MKRIISSLILFLGIALVLSSMALLAASYLTRANSVKDMPKTAELLYSLMPQIHDGFIDDRSDMSMPIAELDGTDYVGLIEAPLYDSLCPVSAGKGFKHQPAIIKGSVYSQDVIVGATDYQMGFARLISMGDELLFTDMTGAKFTYTVDSISVSSNFNAEEISGEDFDLILFIKSSYKSEYVIIYCKL